ncbi:MAG: hypothetical protein ACP5O0_08920 [Acidimicrobiales bacterium]
MSPTDGVGVKLGLSVCTSVTRVGPRVAQSLMRIGRREFGELDAGEIRLHENAVDKTLSLG